MPQETTRNLAAVMFADMVGFTALVGQDEDTALELRNRQREVVERLVPEYGGRVRQFYGDGTLTMFDSAVEAVKCATAIQADLLRPPEVSLRIGIHIGDIVDEGDGVFGDGVNVAARVESLAPAGGVLISDKVVDEIANHPDLTATSLGTARMKNVTRPVEVFALTSEGLPVPGPGYLNASSDGLPGVIRRWAVPAGGIAALAMAASAGWLFFFGASGEPGNQNRAAEEVPSIAILPFINLSEDPDNTFFAVGIEEQIRVHFTKISGLRVISRTSVAGVARTDLALGEIGETLGVGAILTGSVQRSGSNIRVTTELVGTGADGVVWAETYDRALADIFEVQSDIAEQVATALRAELSLDERSRIQMIPTDNLDAYAEYLQGRNQWNLRTEVGLNSAIQHFARAIELDSAYAGAYAGLADSYVLLPQYSGGRVDSRSAYARAEAAATSALRIDPDIAEAHASMGLVRLSFHYDWSGAEQALRRAIDLNPGYATAHQWLSLVLSYTGRGDDAVAEARRAQELDPLSAAVATNLGNAHRRSRDYEPAIRMYELALDFEPDFARAWFGLGSSFLWTDRYGEAADALARWARLTGEEPNDLRFLVEAVSEHMQTGAPVLLPDRLASGSPYLIAWRYALAVSGKGPG